MSHAWKRSLSFIVGLYFKSGTDITSTNMIYEPEGQTERMLRAGIVLTGNMYDAFV